MGSLVRLLAIVASALILIGFAFFATDEMDRGSKLQQQALGEGLGQPVAPNLIAPTALDERQREQAHGDAREVVDDANDVLLAPFANIVTSDNNWVQHLVPALFGLLLYGAGLGIVANALPKERHHAGDWRSVES